MQIFEIVSGKGVNGAIKHALLVGKELSKRGHHVTFVCHEQSWLAEEAVKASLEVIPSDLHRWPGDELTRIAKLLSRYDVDVMHTHLSRAHFFGVILRYLAGVPSVATAQSRHFQLHWMANDHVISVSEATRRYHLRANFVRPQNITTIHNFVESDRIAAVSQSRQSALQHQVGLPPNSTLLGIVGDVIPRKGLIYLVEAMALIVKQNANAHLLIIGREGDEDYSKLCRAKIAARGLESRIHWLGERADVNQLLGGMHIYALPSLEESLPLSVLEAMSAGLPVVATNVGGVAECVANEECGFVVNPKSPHELSQALLTLLRYPKLRQSLGHRGREITGQHFSPAIQTEKIERIFQSVVARRSKVKKLCA
jgi:L-malate glycosyltransferase